MVFLFYKSFNPLRYIINISMTPYHLKTTHRYAIIKINNKLWASLKTKPWIILTLLRKKSSCLLLYKWLPNPLTISTLHLIRPNFQFTKQQKDRCIICIFFCIFLYCKTQWNLWNISNRSSYGTIIFSLKSFSMYNNHVHTDYLK